MRRFFTEPDNIDLDNGTLTIIDDAAHISKVLRMECGDKIIVFDGTGYEYEAMLIKIEKEKSIANILGRSLSEIVTGSISFTPLSRPTESLSV